MTGEALTDLQPENMATLTRENAWERVVGEDSPSGFMGDDLEPGSAVRDYLDEMSTESEWKFSDDDTDTLVDWLVDHIEASGWEEPKVQVFTVSQGCQSIRVAGREIARVSNSGQRGWYLYEPRDDAPKRPRLHVHHLIHKPRLLAMAAQAWLRGGPSVEGWVHRGKGGRWDKRHGG